MNRYGKKVEAPEKRVMDEYILDFDSKRFQGAPEKSIKREPADFKDVFARNGPVDIEIGFGTGGFLLALAGSSPRANILGIELVKKMVWLAAKRAHGLGLKNVRLVQGDAALFVKYNVGMECVRKVHIYFPDPWPKKRHRKRRLVKREFLLELHRVLIPGGMVDLATDDGDYFSQMVEESEGIPGFATEEPGPELMIPTRYQVKWEKMGRSINRLILKMVK